MWKIKKKKKASGGSFLELKLDNSMKVEVANPSPLVLGLDHTLFFI